MEFDVVIVGAGIAGLSCALTLQKSNLTFVVLEAGDKLGGRIQTEIIDGFRLDHGFQVLQKFPPGVAVRYNGKFHIIADPRHHPQYLLSTLASPVGTVKDRIGNIQTGT